MSIQSPSIACGRFGGNVIGVPFRSALTTLPPSEIGGDRVVVAFSSGMFDGPRLKGAILGLANIIVAVGIYRPIPGKVACRVYQIL